MFLLCWFLNFLCKFKIFNEQLLKWLLSFFLLFCHIKSKLPSFFCISVIWQQQIGFLTYVCISNFWDNNIIMDRSKNVQAIGNFVLRVNSSWFTFSVSYAIFGRKNINKTCKMETFFGWTGYFSQHWNSVSPFMTRRIERAVTISSR